MGRLRLPLSEVVSNRRIGGSYPLQVRSSNPPAPRQIRIHWRGKHCFDRTYFSSYAYHPEIRVCPPLILLFEDSRGGKGTASVTLEAEWVPFRN